MSSAFTIRLHSGSSRCRWIASNSHFVVQTPQPIHLFGSTTEAPHPRQRAEPGARLHGRRHRSEQDHDVHPLRRAGREPATAAVPVLGHRGRAAPQPDREVRDGGVRPRADRSAAHLPGASGVRHPLLQGQCRADRQGQPAARGNHAHHRPPFQRALRQEEPGVPGAGR